MLTRQPHLEPKLYDALRDSFGSQARTGTHLSGLMTPRKEFWQNAEPLPPTDGELGYFTAGRGHEDTLVRFLGQHFVLAPPYLVHGISMRPDYLAITSTVIPEGDYAEFKTRRSNLPENDAAAQDELLNYREQVRGYMTLLGRDRMYLIVLSLTEGKKAYDKFSQSRPVFAIYLETMTAEEREESKQRLLHRKMFLEAAVRLLPDDRQQAIELASVLPLCPDWQCGKQVPTLPVTCQDCGKEYKTKQYADKHADEMGHRFDMKWDYVPRCKWFSFCAPWKLDASRQTR